jgi:hypothetical protein
MMTPLVGKPSEERVSLSMITGERAGKEIIRAPATLIDNIVKLQSAYRYSQE